MTSQEHSLLMSIFLELHRRRTEASGDLKVSRKVDWKAKGRWVISSETTSSLGNEVGYSVVISRPFGSIPWKNFGRHGEWNSVFSARSSWGIVVMRFGFRVGSWGKKEHQREEKQIEELYLDGWGPHWRETNATGDEGSV
jgi:hypothetical protein